MIQPDMQSITLVYRQSVTHTDNASASCGSGRSTTLPTNSYQLSNLTDHISFDVGNANAKRINVKTCANFLKTEYECDTWFRRTEDAFYNSRWSTKSVNNINQSIVLVFFSVNFPSLVWTLIKLNSLNLLYVQYRILSSNLDCQLPAAIMSLSQTISRILPSVQSTDCLQQSFWLGHVQLPICLLNHPT